MDRLAGTERDKHRQTETDRTRGRDGTQTRTNKKRLHASSCAYVSRACPCACFCFSLFVSLLSALSLCPPLAPSTSSCPCHLKLSLPPPLALTLPDCVCFDYLLSMMASGMRGLIGVLALRPSPVNTCLVSTVSNLELFFVIVLLNRDNVQLHRSAAVSTFMCRNAPLNLAVLNRSIHV